EFAIHPVGEPRNRVNQIRAYQQFIDHGRPTFIVDSFLNKLFRSHKCERPIHRMSFYRSFAQRDTHASEYPELDARVPSFWDAAVAYTEKNKSPGTLTKLRGVAHALNLYLQTRADTDGNKYKNKDWNADEFRDPIDSLLNAMARGPKVQSLDAVFGADSLLVKEADKFRLLMERIVDLLCKRVDLSKESRLTELEKLFIG